MFHPFNTCECIHYSHCVAGEVGGYMGLLIGASTLTIIEVLDLVVYNVFLKCMGKRYRHTSVSGKTGKNHTISSNILLHTKVCCAS